MGIDLYWLDSELFLLGDNILFKCVFAGADNNTSQSFVLRVVDCAQSKGDAPQFAVDANSLEQTLDELTRTRSIGLWNTEAETSKRHGQCGNKKWFLVQMVDECGTMFFNNNICLLDIGPILENHSCGISSLFTGRFHSQGVAYTVNSFTTS